MRIRWTEPAAQDLINICDYIEAHDSPTLARRVALALYKRVDSLAQFPHRGRPATHRIHGNWSFPICPISLFIASVTI
jgi:plasmid stabilization system protein ParE